MIPGRPGAGTASARNAGQARQPHDRLRDFPLATFTAETRPAGAGAEPLLSTPADRRRARLTRARRNRTCGFWRPIGGGIDHGYPNSGARTASGNVDSIGVAGVSGADVGLGMDAGGGATGWATAGAAGRAA
jgi:hypothetical protein